MVLGALFKATSLYALSMAMWTEMATVRQGQRESYSRFFRL